MRVSLILPVLMAIQFGVPPARASEKWTESKEPVYAQPEPGRALVYVLRDKAIPDPFLGAFEVFLLGAFRELGFPALRVTVHSLTMSLAQVEEFYRQRWPGIRFDRDKKNRKDDRDSPALTAFLESSGTDLVASEVRPEKLKGVPWGVMLMISGSREFEEHDKAGTNAAGGTVIVALNFRNFRNYRP